MFDRPGGGDRAVLVNLDFGNVDFADSQEEIRRLAESAGVEPLATVKGKRQRPDAATFAGSGKVDEIAEAVQSAGASLVLFNHDLSPAQQRNLEKRFNCRVVDRSSLILDIFAQRARSHEGKLQVELVQPRTSRVARCSSWASSTCNLPSCERARCAKMSRIRLLRSTTRHRKRFSRLRCCAGDRS